MEDTAFSYHNTWRSPVGAVFAIHGKKRLELLVADGGIVPETYKQE